MAWIYYNAVTSYDLFFWNTQAIVCERAGTPQNLDEDGASPAPAD